MKNFYLILLCLFCGCQKEYSFEERYVNSTVIFKADTDRGNSYLGIGTIVDSLIVTSLSLVEINEQEEVIDLSVHFPNGSMYDVEIKHFDVEHHLLVLRTSANTTFDPEVYLSRGDLLLRNSLPQENDEFYGLGCVDMEPFKSIEGKFTGISSSVLADDGSYFTDTYRVLFKKGKDYRGTSGSLHFSDNSFGMAILCNDNGASELIAGDHILNILDPDYDSLENLFRYFFDVDPNIDGVLSKELFEQNMQEYNNRTL